MKNFLLQNIIQKLLKRNYISETSKISLIIVDNEFKDLSKKIDTSYKCLKDEKSDYLVYPVFKVDTLLYNYDIYEMCPTNYLETLVEIDETHIKFVKDVSEKHSTLYIYIVEEDINFLKSYIYKENFMHYKLYQCLNYFGNTLMRIDTYDKVYNYIENNKNAICNKFKLDKNLKNKEILEETLSCLCNAKIRIRYPFNVKDLPCYIIEKVQ